jgi:uncharacterized protein YijF (DUF1287 family)
MRQDLSSLIFSLSVVKIGYPGAQVARLLGVSTSAVVRAAHSAELPEVELFISQLRNNVIY